MISKVLCIDDDSISLTISKLLLKRTGFADQIFTAIDGSDALIFFDTLFAENSNPLDAAPNLIFLDINMPVMNGWAFLDAYILQYAEKLPNTKIIILSSTIDPEDQLHAKKYNVVMEFVSKPLSVENIAALKEDTFISKFF